MEPGLNPRQTAEPTSFSHCSLLPVHVHAHGLHTCQPRNCKGEGVAGVIGQVRRASGAQRSSPLSWPVSHCKLPFSTSLGQGPRYICIPTTRYQGHSSGSTGSAEFKLGRQMKGIYSNPEGPDELPGILGYGCQSTCTPG